MTFTATYPYFVLIENNCPIWLDMKDGSRQTTGVPIFTDRDAAQQFRYQHHPAAKIGTLPDEPSFKHFLTLTQDKGFPVAVELVAFDPYKIGKRTMTLPVADVLNQLD